jgi:acyl carrier protein
MVPAVYVELDGLPLNHNMKVDRRALPAPDDDDLRATSETCVREPQTPTERRLMSLWQKLLSVQRVGLDDNFFELGGHSMLALQLILEVEEALGISLEGMDILREPLEVLAAICDRRLGNSSPGAEGRAQAAVATHPVEIFHFGDERACTACSMAAAGARKRRGFDCGPSVRTRCARFVLTGWRSNSPAMECRR